MALFPTDDWVKTLVYKLNQDEQYARIAQKWEGDMHFLIEPEPPLQNAIIIYLDLWHGKCRDGFIVSNPSDRHPAFVLKAPYHNFAKVVTGELDPVQALLTRKMGVQGSMAYLMRNIPIIIDFVRCCREITTGIQ